MSYKVEPLPLTEKLSFDEINPSAPELLLQVVMYVKPEVPVTLLLLSDEPPSKVLDWVLFTPKS